jgi:Ankyrin repeats (3 copies)
MLAAMSGSPAAKRQKINNDDAAPAVCSCNGCQKLRQTLDVKHALDAAGSSRCPQAVRVVVEQLASRGEAVPFLLWREALHLIIHDRQREALTLVCATTIEPPPVDQVQFAWIYAWHIKLRERRSLLLDEPKKPLDGLLLELLQQGATVNGARKCKVGPAQRHALLEAVPTLTQGTALGLMVHCSYAEAIQQLVIQFGADMNAVSDDAGHTPVAQACASGDFETVKLLLWLGGNLHSAVAESLQNPLHEAVIACSAERVAELLVLDADYCSKNSSSTPLLAQQDSAGRTPLHVCAALPVSTADLIEVWQLLLEVTVEGCRVL